MIMEMIFAARASLKGVMGFFGYNVVYYSLVEHWVVFGPFSVNWGSFFLAGLEGSFKGIWALGLI